MPPTPLVSRTIPIFAIDAGLAAGLGLLLLAFADFLHGLAGGGFGPVTLRVVGAVLLPWSVHCWFTGRETPPRRAHALIQMGGDLVWIVASLLACVAYFSTLTPLGKIFYGLQPAVAALVLVAKARATRRQVPTISARSK